VLEVEVEGEGEALDEEADAGVPEASTGPISIRIIMEAPVPVEIVTQNA
jgi:hypothetical protein